MFRLQKVLNFPQTSLLDQYSFYPAFLHDLKKAKAEVIIECPFMTTRRLDSLLPMFRQLTRRGVRLVINTKPPEEHELSLYLQVQESIDRLHSLGAEVLFTGGHHRKVVIIDRIILFEGSLNVLSQGDSCEIMRRIYSEQIANQTLNFLGLGKFIG